MSTLKDGPLRKWFQVDKISDEDFRTALTEAYWLFSLAIDQETAARMRRQSRRGVQGATSRAEIKAREICERRRGEILWLLAGLQGLHLPQENAAAIKRAEELCREARNPEQHLGSTMLHMRPNRKAAKSKIRIGKATGNYPKAKR